MTTIEVEIQQGVITEAYFAWRMTDAGSADSFVNSAHNAMVRLQDARITPFANADELRIKEHAAREALTECEAKLAAAEKRAELVPELADVLQRAEALLRYGGPYRVDQFRRDVDAILAKVKETP